MAGRLGRPRRRAEHAGRRIVDKQRKTDLAPKGARANRIEILEETGDSEGRLRWGDKRWPLDRPSSLNGWRVVENGPVRATVRIRNTLEEFHTAFDRFITLYASMPWIQFRTHVEWNSTGKFVKIAFPTAYLKAEPTYDIPYGTIVRKATGEERPALNWVDLGDEAGGVSLLNDCRNGHDVRDGVIRLDVLRSPVKPATNPDCGNQQATYALYPHAGDWREGRVMQRGYEFNNPLIAAAAAPHEGPMPAVRSFARVDRPNVILSVMKQAEDSSQLIVRAYEVCGQKCVAAIELTGMGLNTANLTNMLEEPLSAVNAEAAPPQTTRLRVRFKPHEIVTLRAE